MKGMLEKPILEYFMSRILKTNFWSFIDRREILSFGDFRRQFGSTELTWSRLMYLKCFAFHFVRQNFDWFPTILPIYDVLHLTLSFLFSCHFIYFYVSLVAMPPAKSITHVHTLIFHLTYDAPTEPLNQYNPVSTPKIIFSNVYPKNKNRFRCIFFLADRGLLLQWSIFLVYIFFFFLHIGNARVVMHRLSGSTLTDKKNIHIHKIKHTHCCQYDIVGVRKLLNHTDIHLVYRTICALR